MNPGDSVPENIDVMDGYLKGLLSHWLTVSLLKLELLTWSSPASFLEKVFIALFRIRYSFHVSEKVSKYEAVHPMSSWNDLKKRVGPYRRVFVFTHRSLPNEPLVILHIALTKDISERIAVSAPHH